jgi:hypothetical protein
MKGLFEFLERTYLLFKVRMALLAVITVLRKENCELKEQIKRMEDDKKNPLIFNIKDGFYYYADDTDSKYPYCPACYEIAQKRVSIPKYTLKCPVCGSDYYQGGEA